MNKQQYHQPPAQQKHMQKIHHQDLEDMDDYEGSSSTREQDRYLPIANIARIMKKVLPNNAKIAKEAKESIQECVSEFISFITSEASDKCQQEKRKTINGDDLLWAMSTLGFDKYVEPLKVYLARYRDTVKGEKPEKKSSKKELMNTPMVVMQGGLGHFAFDQAIGHIHFPAHQIPLMAPGKTETTLQPLPPPPILRQGGNTDPLHHSSVKLDDLPSLQLSSLK